MDFRFPNFYFAIYLEIRINANCATIPREEPCRTREDTAMDDTIGTSYSRRRSWPTRDTELIIIIPTTTTPH